MTHYFYDAAGGVVVAVDLEAKHVRVLSKLSAEQDSEAPIETKGSVRAYQKNELFPTHRNKAAVAPGAGPFTVPGQCPECGSFARHKTGCSKPERVPKV